MGKLIDYWFISLLHHYYIWNKLCFWDFHGYSL